MADRGQLVSWSYERHERATGWTIGTAASALIFWPGVLLCAPMVIVKVRQSQRAFGEALETFNEAGGLAISGD